MAACLQAPTRGELLIRDLFYGINGSPFERSSPGTCFALYYYTRYRISPDPQLHLYYFTRYHGYGASYLNDDLAPLRKPPRTCFLLWFCSTYCRLTYCVGQLAHVLEPSFALDGRSTCSRCIALSPPPFSLNKWGGCRTTISPYVAFSCCSQANSNNVGGAGAKLPHVPLVIKVQ